MKTIWNVLIVTLENPKYYFSGVKMQNQSIQGEVGLLGKDDDMVLVHLNGLKDIVDKKDTSNRTQL